MIKTAETVQAEDRSPINNVVWRRSDNGFGGQLWEEGGQIVGKPAAKGGHQRTERRGNSLTSLSCATNPHIVLDCGEPVRLLLPIHKVI